MEATYSSDMSVSAYKTALCHNPEGQKLNKNVSDGLRSTKANCDTGIPTYHFSLHIPSAVQEAVCIYTTASILDRTLQRGSVVGTKRTNLLCQLKMLRYRLMLPRTFWSQSFNILLISCVTIRVKYCFNVSAQGQSIFCLKHIWGDVIPSAGNCMEGKPSLFKRTLSTAVVVPIVSWR
jgi:hypothetical protein